MEEMAVQPGYPGKFLDPSAKMEEYEVCVRLNDFVSPAAKRSCDLVATGLKLCLTVMQEALVIKGGNCGP